jgi:Holliday junction resolvase
MSHQIGNRDKNEPEVIQALEAQGFTVDRISGKGLPDLLISKAGRMWLCEVKMPKGKLKPSQVEWAEKWRGPAPLVLRTVEDCARVMLLCCEEGGKP